MDTQQIIAAIDAEIAKLQHAKSLLTSLDGKRGLARPRSEAATRKSARALSTEARAKIAAAQKARWARSKKAK